jgi:hypothetical protein
VLSQCGYYCIYAFKIYAAKAEAHNQLLQQVPENLLTKICIQDNAGSIQWEEEGKELRLNDEMYDVVKEKSENGKKYLLCINDKKEDEVLKALASVVKNNTDNSSDKQQNIVKFSIPEWIFELYNSGIPDISADSLQKEYSSYNSATLTGVVEVNSPPPNFYT